jgi:cold shock CspA family protein
MGRSSVSFNKKELEKKRAQKRKEKKKRKEERKANSGNGSLDDMIAYVDENGIITNELPESGIKTEINPEDIAVSTPKKQEQENVVLNGRVEHFKTEKGYGFIKDIASTEKYFFHISDAFPGITEGDEVSFELAKGNRGLIAIKIETLR